MLHLQTSLRSTTAPPPSLPPYTQFLRFFSTSPSPWWCPSLRTAIATKNPRLGKTVHAHIITSGYLMDCFLTNNLVNMYSRCGSLSYARHLFDGSSDRNIVTWNSILAAYALNSELNLGFIIEGFAYFRMLVASVDVSGMVNRQTLAPVLKMSLLSDYVCVSECVHGYAVKIGLELDSFVSGALVNIYAKCSSIRDAMILFDAMHEKDGVLWNVMIKGCLQMGLEKEAFSLFSKFHRCGFSRDEAVASAQSALRCLSEVNSEEACRYADQVRVYATKLGLRDNVGDEKLDVISWNKTMSGYLQAGNPRSTIECFINLLKSSNTVFDTVTLVVVLSAIGSANNLRLGQQIHGLAVQSGLDSSVSVSNSLINMYSKTGCVNIARKVFDYMENSDLISWNSMISTCAQRNLEDESVNMYIKLLRNGLRPDQFTLASVLKACASLTEGVYLSGQVHVHALKNGLISDSFVSTALADVYCRSGKMEEAEFLVRNKEEFDLASWNAIMFGYITNNESQKALAIFAEIHKNGEISDGITLATATKACGCIVGLEIGKQVHAQAIKQRLISDLYVSSGILDMYIKCGDMTDAQTVFNMLSLPDEVAWTALICGCVENGFEDRALSIYHQMRQSRVKPDAYTFATLIKASSQLTALEQGKQIHANIVKLNCVSDPFVGTALIDMYAKCGNIEDSYTLFKKLDVKNIVIWNALLVGLAQHGHGEEAINLFKTMNLYPVKPDKVTFIGVLSACSHSGLVLEAYQYFNTMQSDYAIKPEVEHYSCLVDALSRAGLVEKAENLITSMPYEPSAPMYRALLCACRVKGEAEIGQRVAKRLMELDPSDSAAYVLLSNIYAVANRWDDVKDARKLMKGKQVKKDPGFSWIDVKNKVHLFVVDDRSHSQTGTIYSKVHEMIQKIKEKGYVPDTEFSLLDMEEEEKEQALYYHSEKLAIAFGLISTSSLMTIRVIKNLRVCGDCHNAIKYISEVYEREIVLRDANRFHRFKNGICSCGDYW